MFQKKLPSEVTGIPKQAVGPGQPDRTPSLSTGVITGWFPGTWTAEVKLSPLEGATVPAYWLAGAFFAPWFGLRTTAHPEVGTRVLVLLAEGSAEHFIIGTIPNPTGDAGGVVRDPGNDSVFDTSAGAFLNTNIFKQRGDDLFQTDRVGGELDVQNAMGVGVSFLRHLVRMKGSDLASIETYLMDDLVRIISGNYQHINALGDYSIINDGGRPTAIWRGSSKSYETEGKSNPNAEISEDLNAPFGQDTARQRFSQYLGFLGNIFHAFVHEPAETVGGFAAGRFRVHIGEDGSFLLQSVGDIVLEKAVRVQVPVQKASPEDPAGDNLSDLEYAPHPSLQNWIPGDPDKLYEDSYKLRDYARWLNNWFSLGQFHRCPNDYSVPTEASSTVPTFNLGDDPERKNPGFEDAHTKYITTYATIRIFRDGSILLVDGYGSSLHMAGGHMTLSASKDLRLEAGRDLHITSGRDTTLKSYRHVDILALTGGFTLRAKNWLRTICEQGTLLLEGLAPKQDTPTTGDDNTPWYDGGGVLVRTRSAPVVVDSGTSEFVVRCAKFIARATQNAVFAVRRLFIGPDSSSVHTVIDRGGLATLGPIQSDSIITVQQVLVRNPIPVPIGDGEVKSLVIPDEEGNAQSAEDRIGNAVSTQDVDAFTLGEDRIPITDTVFKHRENSEEVSYKSFTQTLLSSGKPGVLSDINYTPWTSKELKMRSGDTAFYPGTEGKEKVYKSTSNQPLHQPSTKNNQDNRGKPLTTESWGFNRLT